MYKPVTSLSNAWSSGGGIILVDIIGPTFNFPASISTRQPILLPTLALTLHLSSPSLEISSTCSPIGHFEMMQLLTLQNS